MHKAKRKSLRRNPRKVPPQALTKPSIKGEISMASLAHSVPSRKAHTLAALVGYTDDTLVAWQQACVQAAEALRPQPDPERLAKALALAQDGTVALEDDGSALVTSNGTRYRVEADGTCHCPDVQHRGAPCKHTLAVQIHQQTTAFLAPSASAPPPAPVQDTRQGRLPSADRWDVHEAPASCCLRLRFGELELLYTMRDVSDAELTSRVQHLVPWVQDLLDQARERQAHLDTLRQQREAAPMAPSAPADLQALIQQAVQQVLAAQATSTRTASANGQAPGAKTPAPQDNGTAAARSDTPFCHVHQAPLELRSNASGSWWSHWMASDKRYCKGKA
jgi:hypothetical protein